MRGWSLGRASAPELRGHRPRWGLATLVDAAMGLAARSRTDDGEVPATSQLTLAYLTAAREGLLVVNARVRKRGDHLLLCDADVDQDGKTVVHAVATFALL